jgi:3-hydroxybutyryl-CoA dehydrogenase
MGETLSRLSFETDLERAVANAELIIEAVPEKIEIKAALFTRLDKICAPDVVFASNTSALSITEMAGATQRPKRFIGMHFFNPATLMKLVEVVTTDYTSENTRTTILELVARLGKTAVLCKDAPGFIVNHVARPYYLEALRLVEEGVADFETVDRLMENAGFKMGPFKLMDLIGNDINYAVSSSVYESMNKPARLKPSPIQEQKVKNNELGKKTGKGYYRYP